MAWARSLPIGFAFLVACTGAPASEDAGGMDAGAGMDARVAVDAGRPIVCEGTPPACALLDETRCAMVEGCLMTRCAGFTQSCASRRSGADCEALEGCSWSGSLCSGDAAACTSFATPETCGAQAGCTYSTMLACRGEPSACELREEATCESQPGCHPPQDAGPASIDGGGRDAQPLSCSPDGGTPVGCVAPSPPSTGTGCNPALGVECDGDWTGNDPSTGMPFCNPACTSGQCCSPRDGAFQCVARRGDGSCPAADIFVDASRIEGRYVIDEQFFGDADCAIAEGCINDRGMRRLLRFDTYTPNIGEADLYLGSVPARGTSTGIYEWSPCHGHHHFRSYAAYELISADGCCVAVTGRKQAFCLIDLGRYSMEVGSDAPRYNCGFQGIQRGWQDVYSSGLTCQWIDITGVPAGDYLLRIRLNTEHVLLEANYDNNEVVIPVTIP